MIFGRFAIYPVFLFAVIKFHQPVRHSVLIAHGFAFIDMGRQAIQAVILPVGVSELDISVRFCDPLSEQATVVVPFLYCVVIFTVSCRRLLVEAVEISVSVEMFDFAVMMALHGSFIVFWHQ